MKKLFKKTMVLGLAAFCGMSTVTFSGCGKGGSLGDNYEEEIDKNRTQIYVEIFNGGYGRNWLDVLKADFEKDNPQYQVMITAAKRDAYTISTAISTGNGTADVYFTSGAMYYKNLIDTDNLVDLTDIYDNKAEGSEALAVKDKIVDGQLYKKAYSKQDGSGIYCLPYCSSFTGMIIDMDLFIEKGWCEFAGATDKEALSAQGITYTENNGKLYFASSTGATNYTAGDVILSQGRDGKFGTYDDGQPTTMETFELMLAKIQASGTYNPFIYSVEQADYVDNITMSVCATYEGVANYDIFNTSKGTYSRTGEEITYENGYKAYEMEGWRKGAEFQYKYLTRPDVSYATEVKNNLTFEEAKNKFLASYKIASSKNKAGAMLVDGEWWENEARTMFDALGRTDASRGYGQRDYRWLILPYMEGAYGLDGNGKGNIINSYGEGLVFVDKNTTSKRANVEGAKLLVEYSCRDKYIKEMAKIGGYRPYRVDYTDTYSETTPYVRNLLEMLSDEENILVYSRNVRQYADNFMYYGVNTASKQYLHVNAFSYFYNTSTNTVDQYMGMMKPSQSTWAGYIDAMNKALGNS